MESTFLGYNDIKLYCKKDIVSKARGVIVIVHGIFEHLGRYEYITKALNDAGYSVYRYDARGHGKSEGKRGDLAKFNDFLFDLDKYIDLAREENKGAKLILLGHSMGGLVASAYASMFPDKIDLLVLSGAANVTPKEARPLKLIPIWVCKGLKYKNVLSDGVCSDKSVIEAYKSDPEIVKVGSFRLMKNAFIHGCNYVKNNIQKVAVPTLVMHGEKDPIVVLDTGKWTYSHLLVQDKTFKVWENDFHEIFNEVNKDEVIKYLVDWLNNHTGE